MATTTEHEDFCEKSIAIQLNKISYVCQADGSYYTHSTTIYNYNSECILYMYSVMSLNILPHLNLKNTMRQVLFLFPRKDSKTKVWSG